jgi:hypothetical protein
MVQSTDIMSDIASRPPSDLLNDPVVKAKAGILAVRSDE